MPLHDIEDLCRAIVPGAGSVNVEALGVGLLSETYRVERDGARYTLKVAAPNAPNLGLDLNWEARLLDRAAAAGLAPRPLYFDPKAAVSLAHWATGQPWSQDAKEALQLRRVADLLRGVHALSSPLPPRAISPMQWIELYTAALSHLGEPDPDPVLRSTAAARAAELAQLLPGRSVVCHSDMHALNLIEGNQNLVLLDWEYAHVSDPLWDLAGWSANNDLSPEAQWLLLTDYGGGSPLSGDWRRLRLLLWLYDYVCLLWSLIFAHVRSSGFPERARLLDARLRVAANYAA